MPYVWVRDLLRTAMTFGLWPLRKSPSWRFRRGQTHPSQDANTVPWLNRDGD
jgi:hypothetical protein